MSDDDAQRGGVPTNIVGLGLGVPLTWLVVSVWSLDSWLQPGLVGLAGSYDTFSGLVDESHTMVHLTIHALPQGERGGGWAVV